MRNRCLQLVVSLPQIYTDVFLAFSWLYDLMCLFIPYIYDFITTQHAALLHSSKYKLDKRRVCKMCPVNSAGSWAVLQLLSNPIINISWLELQACYDNFNFNDYDL